ncbi:6-phosphogluconolactonase [Altererythrobacter xixiisoli]|uniref:6-phosphogluconolactonase n=1 Tax=Croceibacterium xixiisoli TaxID=1476466 RepID=A0A6I4TZJ8_9SPHN|nr:6-phosphogluconolactonase [Croceibacterium xixiisoli]MXP00492.1 6-phosphogluconolactonase [Croceibacterium xixiisoli]
MSDVNIIAGADDHAIAGWLADCLQTGLIRADGAAIAISLPGGSTPFPILSALGADALDWSRVTVWPGDDRLVAEEHAASNTGRIRAMIEPLGARVQALDMALPPPHFALVWLGMGQDGHIASLFPNTDPQADDPQPIRRLTPDPLPPEAPFDRVTLTIPALLNSDALMFVVRGAAKQAVFEQAMVGEHDLPIARLLRAAHQPVTCFT